PQAVLEQPEAPVAPMPTPRSGDLFAQASERIRAAAAMAEPEEAAVAPAVATVADEAPIAPEAPIAASVEPTPEADPARPA
ncbi:MAG TPA: hypothetical protein VN259_07355, partial [Xanthomonadales bacterium]|nr:hypothetical protein [Xanthomonadales bacterium]